MLHYILVISGLVLLANNHPDGWNVMFIGIVLALFEPDPFVLWFAASAEKRAKRATATGDERRESEGP